MDSESKESSVLPHHEQQPLCTTRAPYRQGRKLTAVKVYTINNESNHLLIFGVPVLNLRQEAKTLFLKFGNLLQFHVSKEHPGEIFSETYHARYERIQSARVAKRMMDTKGFYGGSLHISYAPELETVPETRQKLQQRLKDVHNRLRNLDKQKIQTVEETTELPTIQDDTYGAPIHNEVKESDKLNMGDENIIYMKRKSTNKVIEKKFKSYHDTNNVVEIINFTSTERATLSNINEALNYNKFGNEDVRVVTAKHMNEIKFNKKKTC